MLNQPDDAVRFDFVGFEDLHPSPSASGGFSGVRCLVLGAGGFLGGALAAALRAGGAAVHVYGRSLSAGTPDDAGRTEATLDDAEALTAALRGQDIVFHLVSSSLPETSNRNPAEHVLDEVLPTLRMLELCRAAQVRKVVFASSGGTVYGIPSVVPTPESAATVPISAYGINKLMVERYLELYRHLHGLDYTVLRIANPYGPGQSPFKKQGVVAAILHRAMSGSAIEVWGSGEVTRDFIHVDDVAGAFLAAALYDGPHRTFNVASGQGRSLNEIVADVKHILQLPSLEVVRKAGRPADVPISILDTGLIRLTTGWEPRVTWSEGLAATAAWMRAAHRL